MNLNIATALKGPADKAVTFAAEILKCGPIATYRTKDGQSHYFLVLLADASYTKPVIMKVVFKDHGMAMQKRELFAITPQTMYINNVYMKGVEDRNTPYILATGSSHFFRVNGNVKLC